MTKEKIARKLRDAVLDDFAEFVDKWGSLIDERELWTILSAVYSRKGRKRTETVAILKRFSRKATRTAKTETRRRLLFQRLLDRSG
jgi:hypothetical protein